ncbi:hypothetical protein GH714_028696 [Hevea brasiliensis]|uniref:ABC transporter family protein n=1 Tax=Hevea brasiliensis TaxID=3981 RepID=A0A6A6LML5_HEVBR|nr:hypothetical protein GH714_028696 [Hevea brasiliensis]
MTAMLTCSCNIYRFKANEETLYSALLLQDISFFDNETVGDLTSRLGSDCQQVSRGTGALIYLLILSLPLGLCTLIICSTLAAVMLIYGMYQKKAAKLTQEFTASANQVAQEAFSLMRTVRIYGTENLELERYKLWLEKLASISLRQSAAYGFWNLSFNTLYHSTQVIAVLVGGTFILGGHITAEKLTKFILYSEWLIYSTWWVGDNLSSLMQSVGASEKVFQLMDLLPSDQFISKGLKLQRLVGQIEFVNVSFYYPSRAAIPVLQHVNLSVHPGQVVAIVGLSGSGKSTLVNLLLRLYEPTNGQILIDGFPLRELDIKWFRERIGYVGQEPKLFRMDISSNIRYGCTSDISQKDVEWAAKQAYAHDFISSLPNGYETVVDDDLLSGGQKQRIAIARAILRDPPILILDEATSALDAESEHNIKGVLRAIGSDFTTKRTVIVIAHRLSTIQAADRIVVMNGGQIIEDFFRISTLPTGFNVDELIYVELGLLTGMGKSKLGAAPKLGLPRTFLAHNNAEDWAARARAWAAQKAAMEDHHPQPQFTQVGRTEEQNWFPQTVDSHYQDIQQHPFPSSGYQQFPASAATLHQQPIAYSQENASFNSGESSNVPEGHLPYNVSGGTSSGALTTSPSVLQQEVPSSYSSVTGKEETIDQKDQLYKSLPLPLSSSQEGQHHVQPSLPACGGSIFNEQPFAYGNQGADLTVDLSNQPLDFASGVSRDHDPHVQSSYTAHHDSAGNVRGLGHVALLPSINSWTPAVATGSVYPPIPPGLPSGPQHDPLVAIPSPVSGHAAPPFGSFPGPPTIPSAGVPYVLGPGTALHPTAGFPGDAYGVSNVSERPKKDDEEAARNAAINQEIKRVLTEVLLKVTDELFDEIATKVLHEDDLTVEVEHDTVTSNHKAAPSPPEVPTLKASAKVLVPVKARESETEDFSQDMHDVAENGSSPLELGMNSGGQTNLENDLSKTNSIESKSKISAAFSELSEPKVASGAMDLEINIDSRKTIHTTNGSGMSLLLEKML